MKVTILSLAVLFTSAVFSQTHEIVKHNGEQLDVNFVKHEDGLLHYSLEGSQEQLKISKHAVSFLKDKATSKSELITPKIVVADKKDYHLVQVLESHHTIGLKEADTFEGVLTKTKGETPLALKDQTQRRIKTKSATNGYPFVSIVEKPNGIYQAVVYVY